jgi:hypothetical protein
MRRVSLLLAVAASAVSVATAGAQPAPTGSNAACSAAGSDTTGLTFNSTSNSADKSQIQCLSTGNATLVLTAVSRFNGANLTPPPVLETAPGVYDAMYGHSNPSAGTPFPNMAVWNFNYAALGGDAGDTFTLFIDQDAGTGTSFLECVLGSGDACGLGNQDSENLGFPFADAGNTFDPSGPGTYTFQLAEFDRAGAQVGDRLSVNVVVGTPEPATFALMGTGLLGLGGFVRRRNKKVA